MPTIYAFPLTRAQRAHPVFHPRHVSGGLMVHMTGMVAFVHAYYVLDLRHADGWSATAVASAARASTRSPSPAIRCG